MRIQIFSADTRYNVVTDDGANIFLQTSGPAQRNGDLHLRVIFETGDKKYYWLNNVVGMGVPPSMAVMQSTDGCWTAIGRLTQVAQYEKTFVLRIDVWHVCVTPALA
jgi:hypothetical protein